MKIYQKLLCPLLFFLVSAAALQAQKEISGIIKDSDSGEALIGATVVEPGTSNGTITDIDGRFSLSIADETQALEIGYTGYQSLTFQIGNVSNVEISLKPGQILDEIVVIGYGTVKREDATGSVQSVSSSSFNKGAITGPQELLAGKVAGVTITTGGDPGGGSSIRIRGGSSLSASNDPLIVIDGVPLDNGGIAGDRNPLNIINPNDIETFTVLKDASAAAIYGNRAAGGVILITTKKGKIGSGLQVGYTGNVSVGMKSNTIDVLSGDQLRDLINERFQDGHPARTILGNENTDWQEEIYQSAVGQDHNVNIAGGIGEVPYRVSLGYTNKDGILKTDNFERFSGGINLNPKFMDNRLQLNLSLKGMSINNRFANRGAIGSALSFDPTKPVLDSSSPFGGYWTWKDNSGNPNTLAPANPLALLELRNDQSNVKRFIASAQADYRFEFLPELRANLNLAIDKSNSDGNIFVPENASFAFFNKGEKTKYTEEKKNELLEFYLNYVEEFGRAKIDLMAGYSWQHFFAENYSESANVPGTEVFSAPNFDPREFYLVSLYGRANLSFFENYLLTFTLRRDGTSRFSADNRNGLFPAAAFAWKIVNNGSGALSNLKLRMGWGVTGQQDIGDYYAYLPRYQSSFDNAQYQFGNNFISTLRPNGYDSNVKWEQTTTYNVGFDIGFLNDRLSATLDIYKKDTKDLLNFIPVPAGTNLTDFITTNVGDLENQGIELGINTVPLQNSDTRWNLGFNIAYNKNKITKLTAVDNPNYQGVSVGGISGGVGNTIQIHSVGFPANSFYVFEQVFDEFGVPVEGLYVDRNRDGVVNAGDRYRLEKPAADYTLGYTSLIEYGSFDFSFAGRASVGSFNYNNVWSDQAFYNRLFNSTVVVNNVNAVTTDIDFSTPQYFSDYFVQDASFLKVDHITLGYNSTKLLGDFARVYLTVQNPFIITDYKGLDPEVFGGVDSNIYPRPRTIVLGVSVDF